MAAVIRLLAEFSQAGGHKEKKVNFVSILHTSRGQKKLKLVSRSESSRPPVKITRVPARHYDHEALPRSAKTPCIITSCHSKKAPHANQLALWMASYLAFGDR